jgi:hypothetical protein
VPTVATPVPPSTEPTIRPRRTPRGGVPTPEPSATP